MSFEKAIRHEKTRRKPYRGAKRFDRSCRPHGAGRAHPCPWCEANRMHADLKARGLAGMLLSERLAMYTEASHG